MLFLGGKKHAILFADVAGSSALYKAEGDLQAKEVIDDIIAVMAEQIKRCLGRVIKTIGDEVMASFETCDDACRAAVAIQNQTRQFYQLKGISVRIGIGFGKALKEKGDLFGESVNDAAFVTGIAKGSQIVLTESVYRHLSGELKNWSQEFDKVMLKGSREESTIYRLFWKNRSTGFSETQVLPVGTVNKHFKGERLMLTWHDAQYVITFEETPFVIGRSQRQVNLFIDLEPVSRDHCHIEFRRDKFVLIDHSTNGTYLKQGNVNEIYLRREALPLMGTGSISLGMSHAKSADNILIFKSI